MVKGEERTILFILYAFRSTKTGIAQDAKGPPGDRGNGLSDSSHCVQLSVNEAIEVDAMCVASYSAAI